MPPQKKTDEEREKWLDVYSVTLALQLSEYGPTGAVRRPSEWVRVYRCSEIICLFVLRVLLLRRLDFHCRLRFVLAFNNWQWHTLVVSCLTHWPIHKHCVWTMTEVRCLCQLRTKFDRGNVARCSTCNTGQSLPCTTFKKSLGTDSMTSNGWRTSISSSSSVLFQNAVLDIR